MYESTIVFSLEEKEHKRKFLMDIKSKKEFSSGEAVSYYLKRMFPHPRNMDEKEKQFFIQYRFALYNLLEE